MLRKYSFLLLSVFFLFSSCNLVKTIRLLKKGDVASAHFKQEIPFEYRGGIIVIKVVIEGKTYDFIFDSGATNAVSLELADKLKLQPASHQKTFDAEGKSEPIGFSTLKKLSIGQLDFNNTGCAIIDLKKVAEIGCLKADGLIGANLMRTAVWQIDYKNRKIIVADNSDSLHIPANTPFVSFTPLLSGTPVFKGQINGIETSQNIFDTGSSGDILLEKKDLEKIKDKTLRQIRGYGSNASGLYGRKEDSTYMVKLPSLKIGGLDIKNEVVEFKKTDKGNVGSGFLKNYTVTFDWKNKKAWLQQQSPEEGKYDWIDFGFVPVVQDGKMIISYMYGNSPAEAAGLKLNDQIVSVNSTDYSNISNDMYCEMITTKIPWRSENTLNLVIRSGSEERKVTLVRKNVFENQ